MLLGIVTGKQEVTALLPVCRLSSLRQRVRNTRIQVLRNCASAGLSFNIKNDEPKGRMPVDRYRRESYLTYRGFLILLFVSCL